jgi:uncharacterized membrane protein
MSDRAEGPGTNPEELPFAAPCRKLAAGEPLSWLAKGWADLRAAPRQSLSYGIAMLALSWLITAATWRFGNLGLYLGLVTGFVFAGPWLALTLYSISRRLEEGRRVSLGRSVGDAARAVGNALVFAVILTVVFLVWARAATMVHVFFPPTENPSWSELAPFLAVGTAVGACFSAIVFAASAFSLPMLMDRRTDTVTAVVTSVNAVLRNKGAMVVWASIIVACVIIGAATAWLAFVALLPLIGHATWHAYRRTIDASQWPPLED